MRDKPLTGLRVLIVEDDPLIALDIADTISAAGAEIIGPAHTVSAALTQIGHQAPDVAILDWRLESETASPVAAELVNRAVPFLFHTSSRGHPEAAHPGVPIIDKPTRPEQLVLAVTTLTKKA